MTDDAAILEPYLYLARCPGKDVRGRLIQAFDRWLHVPSEAQDIISSIVSMLHTASLLIDDIEDDSHLRRGQPSNGLAAHKIYGAPLTINAANHVYFLALGEVAKLKSHVDAAGMATVYEIITGELVSLHQGQGLDILWRDTLSCPTEEQYVAMVTQKTGGLLRIAVRLMMACATAEGADKKGDLVTLANLIGVFFQVRDDFMNLDSSEYESSKGFAEDLEEGKFSFPMIHGIRADPSNSKLLNILKKRPKDADLKLIAISHLTLHTKSMEYTQHVLRRLEHEIKEVVARLGGNELLTGIMGKLSLPAH